MYIGLLLQVSAFVFLYSKSEVAVVNLL